MAQTFMVFRFPNEEQAQQAFRKIEGWKQGFRLAKKLTAKVDREETEAGGEDGAEQTERASERAGEQNAEQNREQGGEGPRSEKAHKKGAHKAKGPAGDGDAGAEGKSVRVIVKLHFSDHEKLSYQRWLDRIPTEEPFKSAESEILKAGDANTSKAEELFDSLR